MAWGRGVRQSVHVFVSKDHRDRPHLPPSGSSRRLTIPPIYTGSNATDCTKLGYTPPMLSLAAQADFDVTPGLYDAAIHPLLDGPRSSGRKWMIYERMEDGSLFRMPYALQNDDSAYEKPYDREELRFELSEKMVELYDKKLLYQKVFETVDLSKVEKGQWVSKRLAVVNFNEECRKIRLPSYTHNTLKPTGKPRKGSQILDHTVLTE